MMSNEVQLIFINKQYYTKSSVINIHLYYVYDFIIMDVLYRLHSKCRIPTYNIDKVKIAEIKLGCI
jgi:hypothetical protein